LPANQLLYLPSLHLSFSLSPTSASLSLFNTSSLSFHPLIISLLLMPPCQYLSISLSLMPPCLYLSL
jgi:hypothetical protein